MAFGPSEFEAFLTDISEPFTTGDIRTWAARIRLPFSLVTATGPITMETTEDMADNFEQYLLAVQAMRLDLIVRTPLNTQVCDDKTVIATYRTELLSKGVRMVTPYTSSALMHNEAEGWKMSSIMNALGHHHWTGNHPYSYGDTQ